MLSALKEQYIDAIYKTGALLIREEPFTLRSGIKSHIYIDHRKFLTNHQYLKLVSNLFFLILKQKLQDFTFVGVDSLTSPLLGGSLCALMDKNIVLIKETELT